MEGKIKQKVVMFLIGLGFLCVLFFLLPFPAGAYYPAQAQYQPSVPAAPVMINPTQQQQAPPPQQQAPPQQHKRERKQVMNLKA